MAIKISKTIIEKSYCNAFYVPNLKNNFMKKVIKVFLINLISNYRKIISLLNFFLVKISLIFVRNKQSISFPIFVNNKNLIEKAKELDTNGWCFIENFLDDESYLKIKNNWPKNFFLKFKNNPIKFYYIGLEYIETYPKKFLDLDKKIISIYPELENYYKYLLSNKMQNFVNMLTNKNDFKCHSIACTTSWPKSFLAPHVDTIAVEDDFKNTINCLHFIDGNDDEIEYSGATGIYEDNEFKKKIFIPSSLRNSVLIYNSKINFYHGFNVMKKNTFRKAIGFQFFSEGKN